MKNIKNMLIGFIIGVILCLGVPVFAAALNVVINPYPVLIDGVKTSVEGYNINGFTFLKLADFKKAGLEVKFNEAKKQIEITTANAPTSASSAKSSTSALSVQQNNISGGTNMNNITYDETTGLPVGATYTEYKGCKTAILYNDKIFISEADIKGYFGIKFIRSVGFTKMVYGKNGNEVILDTTDLSNTISCGNGIAINAELFESLIGE